MGDLLLARAGPIQAFGNMVSAPPGSLADLRAEGHCRLNAYRDKPPAKLCAALPAQMPPDQKYAIVVDTQKSRRLSLSE